MRFSRTLIPTLKEIPSEAELTSHQLMLRAGMIRKLAAGVYNFLPLGLKVIKKVEKIIREEMDRIGAQEVLLPGIQPAELWRETGRWDIYGKELLRFKDRHNRDFCLGPTHEEVITDLVRREVRSYRQLPLFLYQIQTKFRDEVRPRFGLMRCREFGMKDAYSFDADEKGAQESYQKFYQAYLKIFSRIGLQVKAVEADTGPIGGSLSHEFTVPADAGEDAIAHCLGCGYAANLEMVHCPVVSQAREAERDLEKVHTPGVKRVEEVASYLNVSPQNLVKTVLFKTEKGMFAALVRGDHEVNPLKLRKFQRAQEMELVEELAADQGEKLPLGYVGPVGLEVPIVADQALQSMGNFVTGANKADYHYLNVNVGRDFRPDAWADIRTAQPGDLCPRCSQRLNFVRGIEVGHCFYLGTKYSHSLRATFLDAQGKERDLLMGCYGIGIGRTVAAVIEQSHDDQGIIFPLALAPFQVIIVPLNCERKQVVEVAEKIYQELAGRDIEVLLDDRDERAGTKLKDADLLGIPLRVTVGEKSLRQGSVELRERASLEVRLVKAEDASREVLLWLENNSVSP